MNSYEIEETPQGILVRGAVPADDFLALTAIWKRRGFGVFLPAVAAAAGATFAIGRKEDVTAWVESCRERAAEEAGGDAELEWLLGPDTGISSLTIFEVLSAKHGGRARARIRSAPSEPLDPDDFGRCYRLLKLLPHWRRRLGEVAAEYPEWAPLVENWRRLEQLYELEAPSGKAPQLYRLMCELRGVGA